MTAMVVFSMAQVIPTLPVFIAGHRDVQVAMDCTDRKLDHTQDQFDVAIRFTEQIEDQSSSPARSPI